jgi:hypothetical protein
MLQVYFIYSQIYVKNNVMSSEPNSLSFSHFDPLKFQTDITNVVPARDTECRSQLQNSGIPSGHFYTTVISDTLEITVLTASDAFHRTFSIIIKSTFDTDSALH